jgi:putative oxidoreductase
MNAVLRLHRLSTMFDQRIADWGGSLVALFLRCYVGWKFFKSGLVKISDWGGTLALFREEYMVPVLPPELAAYAGAGGELVLPVLLFAGLFSRPAALGLFCVNAVAVISYPQLLQFECPAAINDHFYRGVLLLVLIAFGAGRWSVDELIGNRIEPKPLRGAS